MQLPEQRGDSRAGGRGAAGGQILRGFQKGPGGAADAAARAARQKDHHRGSRQPFPRPPQRPRSRSQNRTPQPHARLHRSTQIIARLSALIS